MWYIYKIIYIYEVAVILNETELSRETN